LIPGKITDSPLRYALIEESFASLCFRFIRPWNRLNDFLKAGKGSLALAPFDIDGLLA